MLSFFERPIIYEASDPARSLLEIDQMTQEKLMTLKFKSRAKACKEA